LEESLGQMRSLLHAANARRSLDAVRAFLHDELRRRGELMERRRIAGRVRECHGDLHLGNLVRLAGRIVPFDAIEFDPGLRWIDVLSEVAFLVMDLDAHGLRDLAFEFLNRYLDVTGDHEGLAVLPFYLGYRALVRAKVRALSPAAQSDEARATVARLLDFAASPLPGLQPGLILMCGISGSGKSWLAERIARVLPAVHLRSDVERKRLFGLAALERTDSSLGQGIYAPQSSGRTYQRLSVLAAAVLAARMPVIVDATNLRRQQRAAFIEMARAASRPAAILLCETDAATIDERVRRRHAAGTDPSEAGLSVVELQRRAFEPPLTVEADLVITCSSGSEETACQVAGQLRRLLAV
jgi:hypothetical protein